MKRLLALLTLVLGPAAMAADTEQRQWELIGKLDSVELPERTMEVVRFSGWPTGPKVARMQRKLLETLSHHGIQPDGVPALNQYNPPWTVAFLRSNEVSVAMSLAVEVAVVE